MNKVKDISQNVKVKNAIFIGFLCAVSYLTVYIARNMLSAVSPQMIENGYATEYIGKFSSLFFTFYAMGQLINGLIGDKIKTKYMMSIGLTLAGFCNVVFPNILDMPTTAYVVYGMSGFFLSMIYAPMVKVIAENTELIYAVRCNMGNAFAALLGSPFAGIVAALVVWNSAFKVGGFLLLVMGILCFISFSIMEKREIVKHRVVVPQKEKNTGKLKGVDVLIKHRIILFSVVAILTGVVRTTVVFWLPTYLAQYLGFSSEVSASISSTIFANAVSSIGWGKLILIWCGLMIVGVIISFPMKKLIKKKGKKSL